LGSSNVGGGFGSNLRSCGIQQLLIRGKAAAPAYLWVDGDTVELRCAEALWGLDTRETHERIKAMLGGENFKLLTIGPGGENGALFGCIMTGRDHCAGRTGMGTVMGSKNLKAVVIKRQRQEKLFNSEDSRHEAIKCYLKQIKNSPQFKEVSKYGGAGFVKWADDLGILATRNYRENTFEAAERIDGKNLENNVVRRRGCQRCPVQCKAELQFDDGKFKSQRLSRPEFEPMLSLGSKCGLDDLQTLVYLDNLCSRLGLDNISAGTAMGFAMDLFERKILTEADTGGLKLTWGNGKAMETLIRQMASAEGFGGILAKGIRRAAQIIGRGAGRYAPHVKGLEMAGYHPDNIMGTALGYTIASRGADFNDVYATLEYKYIPDQETDEFGKPKAADLKSIQGKAELVRRSMILGTVLDSLGLCKVPALSLICKYDLVAEAELTSSLTGCSVDVATLFAAGERVINLERLFNLKHGSSPLEDKLPDMFFKKDYTGGDVPSKPHAWMEPMKQEFYMIMGWDAHGQPTRKKLSELNILPSEVSKPADTAA
jgi:aldehyde:ferredoxin oxidoreductase